MTKNFAIGASIEAGRHPFQIDRVRFVVTEAAGMAICQANAEEIDQVLKWEPAYPREKAANSARR